MKSNVWRSCWQLLNLAWESQLAAISRKLLHYSKYGLFKSFPLSPSMCCTSYLVSSGGPNSSWSSRPCRGGQPASMCYLRIVSNLPKCGITIKHIKYWVLTHGSATLKLIIYVADTVQNLKWTDIFLLIFRTSAELRITCWHPHFVPSLTMTCATALVRTGLQSWLGLFREGLLLYQQVNEMLLSLLASTDIVFNILCPNPVHEYGFLSLFQTGIVLVRIRACSCRLAPMPVGVLAAAPHPVGYWSSAFYRMSC